jgi:hypothetical protein
MKYNLSKFGIDEVLGDFDINVVFVLDFRGSVGFGSNMKVENTFSISLKGFTPVLTTGIVVANKFEGIVKSKIQIHGVQFF